MRILPISESKDREAWLEWRMGKIMGSKAGGVYPLSRGADRNPAGLWEIIAEKLAIAPDGEPDMARGHRLEPEAIARFTKETGLTVVTGEDAGVWQDEETEELALSPDASEPGNNPTYAVEVKCLGSKSHIRYVLTWLLRGVDKFFQIFGLPKPSRILDYIPKEYHEQVTHYFVVNPNLKTLYFVYYDDRMALDNLVYCCIPIGRADVPEQHQRETLISQLGKVNALIELLRGL